jgi:hypothetical protein
MLTLNTLASKRSLPDVTSSFGLFIFNDLNKPSEERKSGIPAATDIPAPEIVTAKYHWYRE